MPPYYFCLFAHIFLFTLLVIIDYSLSKKVLLYNLNLSNDFA